MRVLESIYKIASQINGLSNADPNYENNIIKSDAALGQLARLNESQQDYFMGIFSEFQKNIREIIINKSDLENNKVNSVKSIENLLSNGYQIKLIMNNNPTLYFSRNIVQSQFTNNINENFIYDNPQITVTGSNGQQNSFLNSIVFQNILVYAYSEMLLRTTKPDFTAVNTIENKTQESNFPFSTNVDTRLRPISLYLPTQKNRIFYPVKDTAATGYPSNAKYISQDNWYISCGVGSDKGFTVRANNGTTYYFPETNRENQTGYPTLFNGQSIAGRVSVYASKIENQYGEGYSLNYLDIKNSNFVYSDYNLTNKKFLKDVKRVTNGVVSAEKELELNYVKIGANAAEFAESEFSSQSGDVVLKNIKRRVNGALIPWSSYEYRGAEQALDTYKLTDQLLTDETIGDFQNQNQATVYLKSAGYGTGDAIAYQYGGPYRLIGNVMPQTNGMTKQDFLWFYSDITGVKYYKKPKDMNAALVLANQVAWSYSLNNFARAGYAENKSYRVSKSAYTGSDLAPYEVTYAYTARDAALNEQNTTVKQRDTSVGGQEKILVYRYYAYENGAAESYLHGLLKSLVQGGRTETYTWAKVGTVAFGKIPSTESGKYADYQDVFLTRMSKRGITHHGNYSTEFSNFDAYGNAQTQTEKGLNGKNTTAISRASTLTYFNSDSTSADVNTGTRPWLVGLPKSAKYGSAYTDFTTEYDDFGSVKTDQRNGKIAAYEYEELTSFVPCLNKLTDFQWSGFFSCVADYMAGNSHTGRVYKQNVGGDELITYYSQYQYGVPTKIQNPNGTTEMQEVNDFGQIVSSTDADAVKSIKKYDDWGRIVEDHPIYGLAYTEYAYDGLTQTMTAKNASNVDLVTTQTLDGEGRVMISSQKSGTRTIVNKQNYDAFGRSVFQSYPDTVATSVVGKKIDYDEFDRVIQVDDGGSITTFCYQSCLSQTGALSTASNEYGVTTQHFYALADFGMDRVSYSETKGVADSSITAANVLYDANLLQPKESSKGNSKQTYTYYANGLLKTMFDNNSTTATDTSSYVYDTVGRTKTITHPDASVETLAYTNKQGDLPSSRSWNGQTTTFTYSGAGRAKTAEGLGVLLQFGLDAYGRTNALTQAITEGGVANSYVLTYNYNNLGQVTSLKYPSGKTVDFSQQNGFSEISRIPNVIASISYDAWSQPKTVTANTDVAWTVGYDADGKKNSLAYSAFGLCQLSLAYTYDSTKRIKQMTDKCGSNLYNATFDRYGSGQLQKATMSQGDYSYTYAGDDILTIDSTLKQAGGMDANYSYNYIANTSKLDSITGSVYTKFGYDRMNRVTTDGVSALVYDAYGRVKQAGADTNMYAPDGLRVRANRQNYGKTDYVYGLSGELLYIYDHNTKLAQNNVYVAGQQVAALESYPSTDTDRDGIIDLEELEYGTNPNSATEPLQDTDKDGLPDYLETYLGLKNNVADSDGDGFSDGYEYKTLGLQAALNGTVKPAQAEPAASKAWLVPIFNLLLKKAA